MEYTMELNDLLQNSEVFERFKTKSTYLSELVDTALKRRFMAPKLSRLYPKISSTINDLTTLAQQALEQLSISDEVVKKNVMTTRTDIETKALKLDPLTSELTKVQEKEHIEKQRETERLLNEVDKQNLVTVQYILDNNAVTRKQIEQNLYITYPQILSTLSQMMLLDKIARHPFELELEQLRKDLK